MSERRERIKKKADQILDTTAETDNDKGFGQSDYEAAVFGLCFYCDQSEHYNYIEPLDEGRPLSHKNWVAKCLDCYEDKGKATRKEFIDKVRDVTHG